MKPYKIKAFSDTCPYVTIVSKCNMRAQLLTFTAKPVLYCLKENKIATGAIISKTFINETRMVRLNKFCVNGKIKMAWSVVLYV